MLSLSAADQSLSPVHDPSISKESRMVRTIACIAAVALAAGTAHGAFFSFASGTASGAWTFNSQGGATFGSGLGQTPVTLLIDDRNGMLPTLEVSSRFLSSITLTHVASVPLGGGNFAHTYLANGGFSFVDTAAGTPLLTTEFTDALFTARGGQGAWGTTASLQGDSGVSMVWSGANLPGYGLAPGALAQPSFAFGMAALNSSGAIPYNFEQPGRTLSNSLPAGAWFAESSFTAAAIPAPGAIGLLGTGGVLLARRRRR
jgi:hypothetical protein